MPRGRLAGDIFLLQCRLRPARHLGDRFVWVIGICTLLSFFYYAEMQALQDTPETLQWS